MKDKKTTKEELQEWIKTIGTTLLIFLFVQFFLFSPIVVDGDSMNPTLENGDRMIVNKIGYELQGLKRNDIIVFHTEEKYDFIKRVIALPGDNITYQDDKLYINGELQEEPYLTNLQEQLTLRTGEENLTNDFTLREITGLSQIPEGYVFVMGDNRRYSKDSRIIGLVPIEEIVGTASLIYWPITELKVVN